MIDCLEVVNLGKKYPLGKNAVYCTRMIVCIDLCWTREITLAYLHSCIDDSSQVPLTRNSLR